MDEADLQDTINELNRSSGEIKRSINDTQLRVDHHLLTDEKENEIDGHVTNNDVEKE
jgi:hypothetical protein